MPDEMTTEEAMTQVAESVMYCLRTLRHLSLYMGETMTIGYTESELRKVTEARDALARAARKEAQR